MQDLKPVTRAKKKPYNPKLAGNYTPKKVLFKSSISDLDYMGKINRVIQYNFGILIRAELYRRGWTYRALHNLCVERGYTYQLATITSVCNGGANRWNLAMLYKLAYLLELDLHPLQIPEAITYLRANGRSVKEF